jgi:hypothetical protein
MTGNDLKKYLKFRNKKKGTGFFFMKNLTDLYKGQLII